MKKKMQKILPPSRGFEAFCDYYSRQFGSRWDGLLPALMAKNRIVAFVNPFFTRFPIEPTHWHPRAQWCTDTELFGCIHVPVLESEDEKSVGNLLHPTHLRMPKNADSWVRSAEFEAADQKWFETMPDSASTYFVDPQNWTNFSIPHHTKELKLSHKDHDPYYLLDPASVRIARLLTTSHGSTFLDMCAAPGGKSMILLEKMLRDHNNELNVKLIANEFSFSRIKNLRTVLNGFLPDDVRQSNVVITNFDAKMWGLAEQCRYDGILLDAPCTGDRHLLKEKKEIEKWSVKRCKNNAKTQYGLLRSALEAVKIGGNIVYATCALSDIENDLLVGQILRKRKGRVAVEPLTLNVGEATEFGWRILPDKSAFNEGPLYVCKLIRTS